MILYDVAFVVDHPDDEAKHDRPADPVHKSASDETFQSANETAKGVVEGVC